MARKEDPETEFIALVERLHGSGDVRILINYIRALRDEIKYRSYSEEVITNQLLASNINGQQLNTDHILTLIENVLGK